MVLYKWSGSAVPAAICMLESHPHAAQVLEGLVGQVLQRQGALQKLLDAFALLDMLAGLAKFVAAAPAIYVRPCLSATGVCTKGYTLSPIS